MYVRVAKIEPPAGIGRDGYVEWLPNGFFESIDKMPVKIRTDAVIVDEGQDFEADWLEYLNLLLPDDGSGVFYVFYDDNQRLYRSGNLPNWLGEPYLLTRNVRNTDQIGSLVKQLYAGEMRLSGVGGQPVRFIATDDTPRDPPGHVLALRDLLQEMRRAGADPEDIVVLTPKRQSVLRRNRRLGGWVLREASETTGDVLFETIHSFKGRDSAIVILTELDDLPSFNVEYIEALLYVAFSRARSRLYVIAPPWLQDYMGTHSFEGETPLTNPR